jgi:hypothetical protein
MDATMQMLAWAGMVAGAAIAAALVVGALFS